jgi:SNF2 family DNA or RNA helicase
MASLEELYDNPYISLYPEQKNIIQNALIKTNFLVLGAPGTGKTLITVYMIKAWFSLKLLNRVFIVTKNEVIHKYKSELLRHLPFLKDDDIQTMTDNTDRRLFDKKGLIYICDYNQVRLVYEEYAGKLPSKGTVKRRTISKIFPIDKNWAVVFDEVQAVKNIKSDIHKIIFNNTKNALAIIATSGTPTEKIEELYAVFRVLNERIIGLDYHSFMTLIAYLRQGTYNILSYKADGVRKIKNRIAPYMQKLDKEDILDDIVPKTISDINVEFTESFKESYDKEVETLKYKIFENGYIKRQEVATLIQPIYNKVKEVSLENPRFVAFDKLVRRITTSEKLVVWERSPTIIKELSEYYTKIGLNNSVIYGDIDKYSRDPIIRNFDNNPDEKILFISFLTNAEAWEIPSRSDCKRMVFYSLPDRIINYQQCIDRLHRINSKEPVFIYRFILKDSIDEWAKDLLEYKKKINDGVIRENDFREIEIASYARYLGADKKSFI